MISLFGAHGNSGKKLTLAEFAKIIDASVPCSVSGSAVCGRILTQSEYVTPGDVVISAGWYEHNRILHQSLKRRSFQIAAGKTLDQAGCAALLAVPGQ